MPHSPDLPVRSGLAGVKGDFMNGGRVTLYDYAAELMRRHPGDEKRIDGGLNLWESVEESRIDGIYCVQSESNPTHVYHVEGGICDCPDSMRRQKTCKHCWAVEFFIWSRRNR
jgi:hypothetical protein